MFDVAAVALVQVSSNLMLKECAYIASAVYLDENVVKGKQVSAAAGVFKCLVATDANKFMARHLIGAVEHMFGPSRFPDLAKAFPLVLKQLYDLDVLEEEVILDWAGQGVTYDFSPQDMTSEQVKALRESADPFVNWLKEAEEDSDDEGE